MYLVRRLGIFCGYRVFSVYLMVRHFLWVKRVFSVPGEIDRHFPELWVRRVFSLPGEMAIYFLWV